MKYPLAAVVFALIALISPVSAQADSTNLNLTDATLSGRRLADLSTDTVTDLLGRPAAVAPPESTTTGQKRGMRLLYPSRGLMFEFKPAEEDAQQRCQILTVYLAPHTDETGADFLAFDGTITGGINKDTKTKRILELYKEAFDITSVNELGSLTDNTKLYRFGQILLFLKDPGLNITFDYDKTTKFIERMHVIPWSSSPSRNPSNTPKGTPLSPYITRP